MARVADMETAMRMEAPPPRNKQPPLDDDCILLTKKLCCAAWPLLFAVYFIIAFLMYPLALKDTRYESPQFNLTSLNASQPSALVLADKVVVSGWVACFSAQNPNPEPISYDQVNALLRAHCSRQDCRFDEAGVTPFEQPPAVAGQVCASFVGDAMMKMGSGKTVWFDAVRFNANITYKTDRSSLHVVCEDVKVVVSSSVATELDGGAQECKVKRRSNFPVIKGGHYNRVFIVLWVILMIMLWALASVLFCCMEKKPR